MTLSDLEDLFIFMRATRWRI